VAASAAPVTAQPGRNERALVASLTAFWMLPGSIAVPSGFHQFHGISAGSPAETYATPMRECGCGCAALDKGSGRWHESGGPSLKELR
jgi:hypothetical protein